MNTFKMWVFFRTLDCAKKFTICDPQDSFDRMLGIPSSCVVSQQPGDVIYVNALVFHSVLLGFREKTEKKDKWGVIADNVVIRRDDAHLSDRYVTQAAMGLVKDSNVARKRVLPAFVVMEGRLWDETRYKQEMELFISKLGADTKFAARRAASFSHHDKKRGRSSRMEAVRAAKKK